MIAKGTLKGFAALANPSVVWWEIEKLLGPRVAELNPGLKFANTFGVEFFTSIFCRQQCSTPGSVGLRSDRDALPGKPFQIQLTLEINCADRARTLRTCV